MKNTELGVHSDIAPNIQSSDNKYRSLEKEISREISQFGVSSYWENIEYSCQQWAEQIRKSVEWHKIQSNIRIWATEYVAENGVDLLGTGGSDIKIEFKLKDRIRTKLLNLILRERKSGKSYHDFQKYFHIFDGYPIPKTIDDLVRARITTSRLSGVEFLANKIVRETENCRIKAKIRMRGTIHGYYACHLYLDWPVKFTRAGTSNDLVVSFEIQLATTLATIMWEASHTIYEKYREIEDKKEEWQWNSNDPRFISNQLGHLLHLTDGLLDNMQKSLKTTTGDLKV